MNRIPLSARAVLAVCFLLLATLVSAAPLGLSPPKPQPTSGVESASNELDLFKTQLEQERSLTDSLEQKIKGVKAEVQSAPDVAETLRQEIQRLEAGQRRPNVPASQESVSAAIMLLENQTKALQQSLSDVLSRIGEQQALPGKAREQVRVSQQQIQELGTAIKGLEGARSIDTANSLQLDVLRQRLTNSELRKQLAQNRLEGYQKLLDLYTVNRDLLFLQMDMLKSALAVLREKQGNLRIQKAGMEQDNLVSLEGQYETVPELLRQELEENQRLRDLLLSTTDKLNQSSNLLVEGEQELQDVRYRHEVAKQQLELTDYYQSVDEYLLRQRLELQGNIRAQETDTTLHERISRDRLLQFKLDEQLHKIRTDTARRHYIEKKIAEGDLQHVDKVKQDLYRIYESRADVLANLVEINAQAVVNLTNLEMVKGDQLNERRDFYELLNKKLFWRRSTTAIDWDWISQLPSSVSWFFLQQSWRDPLQSWYQSLVKPVYPMLVFALLAWGYFIMRAKLKQRLARGISKIGNVTRDRSRYTVEALLATLIMALPLPLLSIVLAQPLLVGSDKSDLSLGIGFAFMILARWLFLFEFLRHLVRRGGLAEGHFHWRTSAIKAIRRWLPLLYLQLPFAFVFIVVWREGDEFHSGVLGRAAFLVVNVVFVVFCARIFSPKKGVTQQDEGRIEHWYQRWNRPLFWAGVLIPSSLIILSIQGYSFSSMEVMVLMYETLMYGFFIFIAEQVVMRWFAVLERKLAYARAIEKRDAQRKAKEQQEVAASSGDPVPEIELPTMDVNTISEQNRALLRVVFFSIFVVVCYWRWQDFFQAIQIFQEIELWTYSMDTDAGTETKTVTLETLLAVTLALVLSYAGVKNLPGLIEVVILRRLSVDAGIRFAITTTARYLVIATGIMITSGLIGLEWSKLGWLVAALGVGLGFGLQEIFANFISGLIILFERPIRIGDTVTINNLSGIVSQIRMRATTITDWDQKELIIPNKTFVTSQFINWTLSDNTTRVVIKVGVAYGSDTELVAKTLLQVANDNEVVLRDPAPSAFFLGFGASSLDFELRAFVASFSQRLQLIHDLHMEVDKRFRELNVEIAFPQLDLHVKHLPVKPS